MRNPGKHIVHIELSIRSTTEIIARRYHCGVFRGIRGDHVIYFHSDQNIHPEDPIEIELAIASVIAACGDDTQG